MTRHQAFLFACQKQITDARDYINTQDVKSIQLTVTLNKDGAAHVSFSPRTENMIVGCFEGSARLDRYEFEGPMR